MPKKETRRFKRFRASYLVKYQQKGKEEPRITNVLDMSAGGLRFWTPEKLSESTILNISVNIPPLERSVNAWAQVLRVRRAKEGGLLYYVAVSFVDLKEEDREAINAYVESISKDHGPRFVVDRAEIVLHP